MLLAVDESGKELGLKDEEVAQAFRITPRSIEYLRKQIRRARFGRVTDPK